MKSPPTTVFLMSKFPLLSTWMPGFARLTWFDSSRFEAPLLVPVQIDASVIHDLNIAYDD